MSEGKKRSNKRPNIGVDRTRSFDGSNLGPGSQMGQFHIEQELGRGGAGVVFLAHDTRLDRSVAIKSLPPEVTENPKARTRFEREAKILASLNHPNIATIYDRIKEADGVGYIILEYVHGQTLAERIAESKLKLKDALNIALQIAEAVAAAHEHEVIHRDLKPDNIKITPEGKVKVLDFGLAKALGGQAMDQQSTITEPGRIIGTPAYMSPEQARGKPTDKRCDIWSFGCVLYEMLTGKIPFGGETVSDMLANILQTEPNWQALPRYTPASICVILHRCLEKEPNRRLRDIGDAAIEISETLSSLATIPTLSTSSEVAIRYKSLRQWIVGIAFVILIAIVAALLTRSPKPTISTSISVSRFPIGLPQNQMLDESQPGIAVSPDGERLVYVGGLGPTTQLFLREANQIAGRELPDTKGAVCPFFSPDGQWIGFGAEGKLKKLFLDGGKPIPLCDARNLMGGSWGTDDTIYFSPTVSEGLWKISADEGVPEAVTDPNCENGGLGHWWPEVLPGGEAVLFTIWSTTLNDVRIAILSRKTGKWQTLVTGASHARYAPTGHLLYAQSGTLMAAPFDLEQFKLDEPRPVIEGLNQHPGGGYAHLSFSRDGLLFYVRGGEWLARRQLVWINRQGQEIELLPLPAQSYLYPRLSPDSQRFAFTKFDRGAFNIRVYEFSSNTTTQLTFKSSNFNPLWTPDGNRLTFMSFREGPFNVYWMPADRSNPEKPLVTGPYDQYATSWSPDGKLLLFTQNNPDTGNDICYLSTEDGNTPRPLLYESWNEGGAVFSPDGNWFAYESSREGRREIYISPFPNHVPKKISTDGGCQPMWSRDNKELFYRSGDKMIAVTITTEPELKVIKSEVLFEGRYLTGNTRNYDVTHDGQKFLMIKISEEEVNQLVMVPNFFEELKRLVPTGGN